MKCIMGMKFTNPIHSNHPFLASLLSKTLNTSDIEEPIISNCLIPLNHEQN